MSIRTLKRSIKKNIYRAKNVKSIDVEKLSGQLGKDEFIVGIDVAKEDFVAAFMNREKEVKLTVKWKHPTETQLFISILLSVNNEIETAMEPSGTYGDALRFRLISKGIKVFRVSPKRSHDAAEVYDGVPSHHDPKSSAIIAKLHWDGYSEEWPMKSDIERIFKAAIETMQMYDEQLHRNSNRIEAKLARYWPEASKLLGLGSATLLELLSEFGSPYEITKKSEEARLLMQKVGRQFLSKEKIEGVLETARTTIGVPLIKEERKTLMELAKETNRARKLANRSRARVEKISEQDESVNEMGKVVGKATAAVLVSAGGNPTDYSSAHAYVKSLGLNLKEHSSGKHKGQLKITKRGPGIARQYLYMAVLRLIQKDLIIKAWYAKKVKRDAGKVKTKGLIAIMRKIVLALWHVAQGKTFDSSLLYDVRCLELCN